MHGWTIPAKSFDATDFAAAPPQAGSSISLDEVMTEHACEAVATGIIPSENAHVVIFLEGSLDGTNWYALGSPLSLFASASSADTEVGLITVSGQPALYVRTSGYNAVDNGSPVVTTLLTSG